MITNASSDGHFEHDSQDPARKVSYDPRLSLNTVVMCLTILAVAWGLIDKLTSGAAMTATLQSETRANAAAISQINNQRILDRQELLIELRAINDKITKAPVIINRSNQG